MKKCQICGKRASMFLTQIINGQATELALCESCAKAKGLFDPQSLTFAEKFFPEEFRKRVDKLIKELTHADNDATPGELPDLTGADALTSCPVCHFSLEDYRRTGRFGCPSCYDIFGLELPDVVAAQPAESDEAPSAGPSVPGESRTRLENRLAQAIKREDYEEAARLRDIIRGLE